MRSLPFAAAACRTHRNVPYRRVGDVGAPTSSSLRAFTGTVGLMATTGQILLATDTGLQPAWGLDLADT